MKTKNKHSVVFTFKSRADKEFFLVGLCDGWGENECALKWPDGIDLCDATEVKVTPFREEDL